MAKKKKQSTLRTQTAKTTTGATKLTKTLTSSKPKKTSAKQPLKTTGKKSKKATTKSQSAKLKPRPEPTPSTPTAAIHAGLATLRHRLQAKPATTAPGRTKQRGKHGRADDKLDAALTRLAADYTRVLGRP